MNAEALDRLRARLPDARARVLRRLTRFEQMRFPTFPPDVHGAIARSSDYVRYAALALAVQRVLDEDIPGDLAEVGVWHGKTSAFLHDLAPSRRLHLFDTFEGFDQRDLEPGGEDRRFRHARADSVRARLGGSDLVVLHEGHVPETLAGVAEERFAFVLLDLDVHGPTAASLEFFYPRLASGAYLVVHDYNSPESGWAGKRAFDAFLADKPERLVELPDRWGSALVRRI